MFKKLDGLVTFILVISGLVWGLIGIYNINVIEYIFNREWLIRVIYVFFGFAFMYRFIACRMSRKKKNAM